MSVGQTPVTMSSWFLACPPVSFSGTVLPSISRSRVVCGPGGGQGTRSRRLAVKRTTVARVHFGAGGAHWSGDSHRGLVVGQSF